jgi:hypothetical protein
MSNVGVFFLQHRWVTHGSFHHWHVAYPNAALTLAKTLLIVFDIMNKLFFL